MGVWVLLAIHEAALEAGEDLGQGDRRRSSAPRAYRIKRFGNVIVTAGIKAEMSSTITRGIK
jgi:hypothetical protein